MSETSSTTSSRSGPMQPLNDMSDLLEGLNGSDPTSIPKRRNILNKRSVKFPDKDAQLHLYHEGPDIEIIASNRRDIWYQYEELKHIKRKALVLSKEAQRYGLGSVLTNTYGKSTSESQEAVDTWVRNASSRRGLERWINEEYAAKRSDIRRRTIQSVLRAQLKMQESSIQDVDYSMKVLSRLSEAFSVDSKEFARAIGLADETTCRQMGNSSGDNDSLEDDTGLQSNSNGNTKLSGGSLNSAVKLPKKIDPLKLRKAPLRLNSPRTVLPRRAGGLGLAGTTVASSRRDLLALAPESSTDFRHFY